MPSIFNMEDFLRIRVDIENWYPLSVVSERVIAPIIIAFITLGVYKLLHPKWDLGVKKFGG
jgi:TctA family transporter